MKRKKKNLFIRERKMKGGWVKRRGKMKRKKGKKENITLPEFVSYLSFNFYQFPICPRKTLSLNY